MSTLVALLDGRVVGTVRQAKGRLSFRYEESWRTAQGAYPLSLSLPLAAREHGHAPVNAFLWGLLPENEIVLDRWAKRFHISARNPFALIGKVGEDCAGAVQFAAPDRVESIKNPSNADMAWLAESEVAERLRALQSDIGAWRAPRDTGQFSLAGAQPKTALYFDGQRWGVPSGRMPTTHILKPPTGGLDGHVENEHLCLAFARSLGLPVARSEVRIFDGIPAIVVERYDRVRIPELAAATAARAAAKAAEAAMHAASDSPESAERAAAEAAEAAASAASLRAFAETTRVYRVHQEDFCQALGVLPTSKYQNEGGPGPGEIVNLLRAAASGGVAGREVRHPSAAEEDVKTFVDVLIFNWLIGGTDAHAKNYSLLLGAAGLVRLAPLYDLASILAYPNFDPKKQKLAMKIGGEYRLLRIGLPEWRDLAAELQLEWDAVFEWLRSMIARLPDCISTEWRRAVAEGLKHPAADRLTQVLIERARDCARSIRAHT